MQSIENKVLKRIQGKGKGWAFCQIDFLDIGSRSAVDNALFRQHKVGAIRRVIRGIYDYPQQSSLLDTPLSPDPDQVAPALARKFGWRIQPSGPAALNLLGLSTQVPGQITYLSDGPDRSYTINNIKLIFKKTALKESGFKHPESALVVQSLKSLGQNHVTEDVISKVRNWLRPELRSKVLNDTRTVTGWIHDAIKKVCREEISDG